MIKRLADFDRVVILSIDRRQSLWPELELQLTAAGIKNFSRFVAGDGKLLPASFYNHIDPDSVPSAFSGFANSYKAFLCFQRIIHSAHAAGADNVLIFEDDAELTTNANAIFEKTAADLIRLGLDWDLLYLGANHSWATTYQLTPNLLRLAGSFCFHAIAIHRTVFDQILSWSPQFPIDLMAGRVHMRNRSFATWPSIAIQKPGFSHVEGRERDYSEYWACQGNPCIRL